MPRSINLYFERVQPFLPLLHQPRFYCKFFVGSTSADRFLHLSLEDALTLTGVMALSARFHPGDFFGSTPYRKRGKGFATQATALYTQGLQSDAVNDCSLTFLQGCILLAFYMSSDELDTKGWLLVGTCHRLGIELRLDQVDSDIAGSPHMPMKSDQVTAIEWSHREEQRRAWWQVWELDFFTATVLRRRRAVGKDQMHILMPVSDSVWFSDTPTLSVFMLTDDLHIWRTLEGFASAHERSWLLVTQFLMAIAADFSAPNSQHTLQDIVSFEATLDCFAFLLPEAFHLDFLRSPSIGRSFASNNWVYSTIIMLHRYDLSLNSRATDKLTLFSIQCSCHDAVRAIRLGKR